MTREKQIDEFANSQIDCEFFNENLYEGIIIGAKWADEHPKSEMVNKEEFIKKACKIYRKHLIKFNPTLKEFPTALDEAVNIFRKQMEE